MFSFSLEETASNSGESTLVVYILHCPGPVILQDPLLFKIMPFSLVLPSRAQSQSQIFFFLVLGLTYEEVVILKIEVS